MSSNSDAKDVLRDAVVKAATAVADSPTTNIKQSDVPAITAKVLDEVAPVLVNATNQEPWYQSRVMWGSIVAIAAPIIAPVFGYLVGETVTVSADEQAQIASWLALVGSAVGGLIAIYGRFVAKKPIGS